MPGIAHLVNGMVFAVLLYNTNPKRFTRKHALIFALMSYIGPDFAHMISFADEIHRLGHSILGWPIYALWILPFLTFLTRFTFDTKSLQLLDEGPNSPNKLPWWQVYLLMIAGGLFHFSVDITFERKRVWAFPMDNPWFTDIESFKDAMNFNNGYPSWLAIIPGIMILAMFILYNHSMKLSDKKKDPTGLNILVLLFLTGFIVFYAIVGVNGEEELGAITFFTIFYFGPFAIALLSRFPEQSIESQSKETNIEQVNDSEKTEKEYDTTKGEFKLKIVVGYFFLLGFISIIASLISIFIQPTLNELIGDGLNFNNINFLPAIIGIVMVFGIFHLIIGMLLKQKKEIGQNLARFFLVIGFLIMIPMAIWGLLREKEVVELCK
jgi:hypothetical protein